MDYDDLIMAMSIFLIVNSSSDKILEVIPVNIDIDKEVENTVQGIHNMTNENNISYQCTYLFCHSLYSMVNSHLSICNNAHLNNY